ncbi:hypothetical protein BKI52_42295 [marine bacterium AO1-C]|nr:hypothetical protein BKI52_42295 [marine bacterium AO1-C]
MSLTYILPLLGVVQGVIIIVVILQRKVSHPLKLANRFFAAFTAILTIATLGLILDSVNFKQLTATQSLLLYTLPFHFIMFLGPVLWLYGRSLFEKDFKWSSRIYRHFYLGILDIVPFLTGYMLVIPYNLNWLSTKELHPVFHFVGNYNHYIDIVRFVSVTIYISIIWRSLPRWKKMADQRTFRWFKNLLIGVTIIDCIWAPYLVVYVSPWQAQLIHWVDYFPVYYPIVALIYYLGIRLMTQNQPLRPSQFAADEMSQHIALLRQKLHEEKLYRQTNLKLEQLSEQTGITTKQISFILNHHFKKGFNDFINEYRIQEAIDQMNENALKNTTMEGIALDVGFSSRSTFYRAFKKVTGESPTAYLKK